MAHYGKVIDPSFDFSQERDRSSIYQVIAAYFDDPVMTKVSDDNGWYVYMTKISSYTLEKRYLVAITDNDYSETVKLSEMRWSSFQSRTLDENKKLSDHVYTPKRGKPWTVVIDVIKREFNATTYEVTEFPIIITLLHKKQMMYEYQNKGTLSSALETFNTIVTFQ